MNAGLVVVAVGGNSLITDNEHSGVEDQAKAAAVSMNYITDMIAAGWRVVVTHGNGPQVGFLLRRVELAREELPGIPLDVLGADTQGATGYMFVKAIHAAGKERGLDVKPVAVVTQMVVDANDPAMQAPSKPIGSFLSEEQARQHEKDDGWQVVEDAGRGWRRVVPSPLPQRVVEIDALRQLIDAGFTVICAGGGGIPVIETEGGYQGVEAVIDKDFATALLAEQLEADVLLISTAVDAVAINFNTPEQEWLSQITAEQAQQYLDEGQFGKGSMAPKVGAAIDFLKAGGKKVIITSPENMALALEGRAGTTITAS